MSVKHSPLSHSILCIYVLCNIVIFLFSSPCQTWWWPYRKGPKHVYLLTPYTVIKCCVLTHPPYIILIFDIVIAHNGNEPLKDSLSVNLFNFLSFWANNVKLKHRKYILFSDPFSVSCTLQTGAAGTLLPPPLRPSIILKQARSTCVSRCSVALPASACAVRDSSLNLTLGRSWQNAEAVLWRHALCYKLIL